MFECIVYAHILKGVVYAVGDFEAVACWLPPGADTTDWITSLRSGEWKLLFKLGKEGRRIIFDEYESVLENVKLDILKDRDENSWYLTYIGTLPCARGKGFARKLINTVTDIADAANEPCYLESSKISNIPIYNRFGFETKRTVTINIHNNDIIELPCMVREPVAVC